jgi:hypothetical protein
MCSVILNRGMQNGMGVYGQHLQQQNRFPYSSYKQRHMQAHRHIRYWQIHHLVVLEPLFVFNWIRTLVWPIQFAPVEKTPTLVVSGRGSLSGIPSLDTAMDTQKHNHLSETIHRYVILHWLCSPPITGVIRDSRQTAMQAIQALHKYHVRS